MTAPERLPSAAMASLSSFRNSASPYFSMSWAQVAPFFSSTSASLSSAMRSSFSARRAATVLLPLPGIPISTMFCISKLSFFQIRSVSLSGIFLFSKTSAVRLACATSM